MPSSFLGTTEQRHGSVFPYFLHSMLRYGELHTPVWNPSSSPRPRQLDTDMHLGLHPSLVRAAQDCCVLTSCHACVLQGSTVLAHVTL